MYYLANIHTKLSIISYIPRHCRWVIYSSWLKAQSPKLKAHYSLSKKITVISGNIKKRLCIALVPIPALIYKC